MKIVVAGAGAFGRKHLSALQSVDGITVAGLVEPERELAKTVATAFSIGWTTQDLNEALAQPEVDAVVLATPSPQHAAQAIRCLEAGKHVQVEIPLAESYAAAVEVVQKQASTGLVAMCGHTRRFNPSHQWLHQRLLTGELKLQHLVVETYFFRRENTNAEGEPRSWTDHLLWHHAAHTVDLFRYQAQQEITTAQAVQGPVDPALGIAMDMNIQLKGDGGALCTLALSFNNEGPFGTTFRYICDNGTFVARYDNLITGDNTSVDLSSVARSSNGIELQNREFLRAIQDNDEPNASVRQVLPCYETLHSLEQSLSV